MRVYENQPAGTVDRARTLRRASTDAEKAMWRAMRSAFPQHKWRRQVPIGPYYADFLCFGEKLIVEIDGGQHSVEADAVRTRFLESEGYRIIRFWNNDVLQNLEGVLSRLSLSLREREEAPKAWKGECEKSAIASRDIAPSPSHRAAPGGPLPLPKGEG
ncbi:endonuclease domain-containing protein [Novosphingopyxis sp. YJ-S2-01]|uniref:endonuclease domain-containing protein n=1 Tax=Novosphingopyxis sp. YJ-S2-01 TaxID=2794021 RepID=UPI0018DE3969|nr:DUF559 domain-containing protein [Novosphingopyxis sp. YJ-S2-01]MBH9536731.1 endonuclease domain-containing protein [Novosphingopyxis sp. YJ-S2-01]